MKRFGLKLQWSGAPQGKVSVVGVEEDHGDWVKFADAEVEIERARREGYGQGLSANDAARAEEKARIVRELEYAYEHYNQVGMAATIQSIKMGPADERARIMRGVDELRADFYDAGKNGAFRSAIGAVKNVINPRPVREPCCRCDSQDWPYIGVYSGKCHCACHKPKPLEHSTETDFTGENPWRAKERFNALVDAVMKLQNEVRRNP